MKQAAYTVYGPPTLSLTHDRRNWNEIILIQKKKKRQNKLQILWPTWILHVSYTEQKKANNYTHTRRKIERNTSNCTPHTEFV